MRRDCELSVIAQNANKAEELRYRLPPDSISGQPGSRKRLPDKGRWCRPGLREALRDATRDVHERLHRHPGLSAIAAGRISLTDYRSLLKRLLGFYVPLERALGLQPERSPWLQADVDRLEAADSAAPVMLCPYIPRFDTGAQRLGGRYVMEGAALGGRLLAERLDLLLGHAAQAGRLFFIGRGTASACAWRSFLAELVAFEDDTASHDSLIKAACDTFEACEKWLAGWKALGAP